MAIYRNLITDEQGEFLNITSGAMDVNSAVLNDAQDDITGLIGTIDIVHHEIHEGEHYFVQNYRSLGNAAVKNFLLTTGAKYTHLTFSVNAADAGIIIETYENVVANVDGTLITILNNNRNSANTSANTWREDPTGINITGATPIRSARIGTGTTPPTRQGGIADRGNEIIMKPNTKYLLRVTNLSTSANNVNFDMQWYEEE